ncbi:hypothetical protein DESC_730120 [Desulfosarcina cetonica]|nr:hypothetical protein DESC_730120 [Desulfosarcina cetonica]
MVHWPLAKRGGDLIEMRASFSDARSPDLDRFRQIAHYRKEIKTHADFSAHMPAAKPGYLENHPGGGNDQLLGGMGQTVPCHAHRLRLLSGFFGGLLSALDFAGPSRIFTAGLEKSLPGRGGRFFFRA